MSKVTIRSVFLILLTFFSENAISQNQIDIETSGDFIQLALPIAAFTSTLIWSEDDSTIWQFGKTMGASIIVTHSLKMMINKDRPNGATDGHAFPSGHTSAAFTGAAFLNIKFGWKIGVPAYVLASYVGWTRVKVKRHDAWDILGGALTGIGCAYLFKDKTNKVKFKVSNFQDQLVFGLAVNF